MDLIILDSHLFEIMHICLLNFISIIYLCIVYLILFTNKQSVTKKLFSSGVTIYEVKKVYSDNQKTMKRKTSFRLKFKKGQ